MEISNPRRILFLSPPGNSSSVISLLHHLTGSTPPEQASASLAGVTHALRLETRYYAADVQIWLDELPLPSDELDTWLAAYLHPNARDVLRAIGSIVLCFPKPRCLSSLEDVRRHVKAADTLAMRGCGGGGSRAWDGVCVGVGLPALDHTAGEEEVPSDEAALDETLGALTAQRFEYVDGEVMDVKARNVYGEKRGVPRLREALEAVDWAALDDDDEYGVEEEEEEEGESRGDKDEEFDAFFARLVADAEAEAETAGGKEPLRSSAPLLPRSPTALDSETDADGDAGAVAALEEVMKHAMHVREQGSSLRPEQRRREARRVVVAFLKGGGEKGGGEEEEGIGES